MSTTATRQDTTVSIIHGIFGAAHFVFQSAADLTVHAESKLVEKVTKGEISYNDNMRYRRLTTFNKQQDCLDKIEEIKSRIQNKKNEQSHNPKVIITT